MKKLSALSKEKGKTLKVVSSETGVPLHVLYNARNRPIDKAVASLIAYAIGVAIEELIDYVKIRLDDGTFLRREREHGKGRKRIKK